MATFRAYSGYQFDRHIRDRWEIVDVDEFVGCIQLGEFRVGKQMLGRANVLLGLSFVLRARDRNNHLVGQEPAECYLRGGAPVPSGDAGHDSVDLLYLLDILVREEFVLVSDVALWNMPSTVFAC